MNILNFFMACCSQIVFSLSNFTYTGAYTYVSDGSGHCRIKFLTSGTLVVNRIIIVDLFLAGGGGGASRGNTSLPIAGNGGFTRTVASITLQPGTSYPIVIGNGGAAATANGAAGSSGEASSAFSYSALGGDGGNSNIATYGGSGAAGRPDGVGGTNGSDGTGDYHGYGQGTTTKEFADSSGTLYSSGGNAVAAPVVKTANSGNGGDCANAPQVTGTNGASGIAVIRDHR